MIETTHMPACATGQGREMARTQVVGSTTDGPVIAHSLEELEEVVRRDLAYTGYPAPAWVPGREVHGQRLLDVTIAGSF